MNIELPDGSTLQDVPDGTTKAQVIEKLHKSGNPNWETMARAEVDHYSPTHFMLHAISEPLAALFTGAVAAPLSGLAGLAVGAAGGDAAQAVEGTQQALTYQPRSQLGQKVLSGVTYPMRKLAQGADVAGQAASNVTGSPAVGAAVNTGIQAIPMLLGKTGGSVTADQAAATAAKSAAAAARAAHFVESNTALKWNQLGASSKAMMTSLAEDAKNLEHLDPVATERVLRAHSQGVPMTRGQATRDLSQITREEGLRKSDAGLPLRNIQSKQDEALFYNLETLKKDVAPKSKVSTPQAAGAPIQAALRRKMQVLQADVTRQYAAARKSGESAAPVDITPLEKWLEVPVNKRNAGFLRSAIEDYKKDPSGSITINNLEEIRKEAVANALGPRSATTHFAGEAIGIIDKILDSAGGNLFKGARAAHRALKEEFDKQGALRQLTGVKGATDDRALALEDTLERTVVRGSNEDLVKVRKSLLEGGTEQTRRRGAKAWADLQAGAIAYLHDKAGGKRQIHGEAGQQQFNGTFLDGLYDLDRDGKLSTLFGERVAERVRLLAKTVADVRTTPTGRISGSDSVPRILNMLEKVSHFPVAGSLLSGTVRAGMRLHEMGREGREAAAGAQTPLESAAASATKRAASAPARQKLKAAAAGSAQSEADARERAMDQYLGRFP